MENVSNNQLKRNIIRISIIMIKHSIFNVTIYNTLIFKDIYQLFDSHLTDILFEPINFYKNWKFGNLKRH